MNATTPAPTATTVAFMVLLTTLGFVPQTSTEIIRGGYLIHFYGPDGVEGPHGFIRLGAKSNKVLSGHLFPLGEGDYSERYTSAADLYRALVEWAPLVEAADDTSPKAAPPAGSKVRYHGSRPDQHGVWTVRGIVRYGAYAGRVELYRIRHDTRDEQLIVSAGNRSFTPLPALSAA